MSVVLEWNSFRYHLNTTTELVRRPTLRLLHQSSIGNGEEVDGVYSSGSIFVAAPLLDFEVRIRRIHKMAAARMTLESSTRTGCFRDVSLFSWGRGGGYQFF